VFELGPMLLLLQPYDEVVEIKQAVNLKANEFVRFLDKSTGKVRVEKGEQGRVYPEANEIFLDEVKYPKGKRQAIDLKINEYVKIEDHKLGTIRIERGEKLVFLGEFEEIDAFGKRQAFDLKSYEYVRLEDKKTGNIRVEKGEKLVFMTEHEEKLGGKGKERAIEVDDETCV
jgi:hypothetical protein